MENFHEQSNDFKYLRFQVAKWRDHIQFQKGNPSEPKEQTILKLIVVPKQSQSIP